MPRTKTIGLDKLRAKFRALPGAVRDEIRAAMEAGAAEVVRMARSLCPVDRGDLRDSIGWTWGEAPAGSITLGQAKGPGEGERITIYAGDEKAFYARWVEFGTVKMPARPFFYPSWRALRKRVKGRHTRALTKALKKVAGNGN